MMRFCTTLCCLLTAFGLNADEKAQRTVRVRVTAGGPQIHVDGKAVPPRMMWGVPGLPTYYVESEWKSFDVAFVPQSDIEMGTFSFRFDWADGSEVKIRNIRFSADGISCETKPEWNHWPQDSATVFRLVDGEMSVSIRGASVDYNVYLVPWSFKKGVRYSVRFEACAVGGCQWIRPCVYSIADNWKRFRRIPLEIGDTLLATMEKAEAAGVNFVSYYTSDIWKKGGDDFEEHDRFVDAMIRVNPNVLLIPRVDVNAPGWWLAEHPEHRMQYAEEQADVKGPYVYSMGIRPEMAAVSSRPYREAAIAYIVCFCRHMMERYPENFAGIHPCGQNSNEWFYFDSWNKMHGFDPETLSAYRKYTGNPNAVVPTFAERNANAKDDHLLDGVTQRNLLTFNRFLQDDLTDFLAEIARACRQATGGKKLVLFFYGYAYEFSAHGYGPANSGHYGVEKLLGKAAGDIDILCSPISYGDRAFCGSAPAMSCAESIMRRGVLWLNEDDTRTYLDRRSEDSVQEGSKVMMEQSRMVALRNTAEEAIRGFGSWWMDLPGFGWYDSKELWGVQKALMHMERSLCRRSKPYAPDVALILDEESMLHVLPGAWKMNNRLIRQSKKDVNRAGAPYGQYFLSDAASGDLRARLQIYQACWCLDDETVDRLIAAKRTVPAWRVWCWAAGAQDKDGREDLDRMCRLNGFALKRHDLSAERGVQAFATDVGVSKGLRDAHPYGTDMSCGLAYAVDDAKPEEVWARYPNGDAAIVVRRTSNGGDVFLGVPDLASELVYALEREASVHSYLTREEIGRASVWATCSTGAGSVREIVSVQAMKSGELSLRFATVGTIHDACTGKRLGEGGMLSLSLSEGESRVLCVSPDSRRKEGTVR